ncbi:MAG TPA: bifunctional homocysteine S-methyltransferase/methylenetetrahydrofolate reductase [Gaiellaceae bacterium]|nr:bifunctional homocysteine S-methyltransferase/methylenetetrahydrofolate reductase [Gaiellaceae bacterium]
MSSRFEERLSTGPIVVGDGGMGVLITSAVPRLRCPEEANLRAPESVVTLHTSFIRAGADLIETNTFGANRRKLSQLYLEDEFERINSAGVKLAREAREVSGREVFVAGSIGPLGDLAVPPEQRAELFAEQAALLDGRGIDLFMIETFYDLDELETAIEAVRGVSSLPIVATLTFDEGAETLAGVTGAEAAERLRPMGLAAIGANHGAGLHAALGALESMGGDGDLPLAALPNVGLASLSGGRVIYPHATPEYFAEFAAHARRLGARLIGGCCGTTPLEIAAIASAVEQEREPSAPLDVVERELVEPRLDGRPYETELARKLREGEWVTCVELDPPKGGTYDAMLGVARHLKLSGKVDLVDINDNPMARARANALMASVAIERECGIETIPHVTPRDTSIMGLESLLLGAHAEGVRNVLSVTGDPPEIGDYPGSQGVYEVDSIGLSQVVSQLNRGEDYNGKGIDAPTSFFLGVAVNPSADDLETEAERFRQKIEAGASFAMTQALFDLSYLDRFEELIGGWPVPLLLGIFYVRSYQLAVRLHNEVPGIVVPEEVQRRLEQAGPRAGAEGLALAKELYAEAREKVAGVYVIPPFKQPEAALDLLD